MSLRQGLAAALAVSVMGVSSPAGVLAFSSCVAVAVLSSSAAAHHKPGHAGGPPTPKPPKVTGAPGPVAGAGLPFLLAGGGYVVFRRWRKRRARKQT